MMNKPNNMLICNNDIYPFLEPDATEAEIRLAGKILVEPNHDEPGIRFGMGHFYLYPEEIRQLITALQYALSIVEPDKSADHAD